MYDNRILLSLPDRQYDSDIKPEPHQKQSIKGLFTFYRQQEEFQLQKQLQQEAKKKQMMKPKTKKSKSKSKINKSSKSNSNSKIKNKSSNKEIDKKSSGDSQKIIQNLSQIKTQKSKKKLRHIKTQNIKHIVLNIDQYPDGQYNIPFVAPNTKDIAEDFLKLIKKKKGKKLIDQVKKLEQKTQELKQEKDTQKFHKLLYPKTSNSESIINKNQKTNNRKKVFGNFAHLKKSKAVIIIDEIFLQKNSSQLQKSLNSRKKLYSQLDQVINRTQKKEIQMKVQRNFYSPDSNKKQNQIIPHEKNIQQSNPISPPTQQNNKSVKSNKSTILKPGFDIQLKLPEINDIKHIKNFKRQVPVSETKKKKSKSALDNHNSRLLGKNLIDDYKKISQSRKKNLDISISKNLIQNNNQQKYFVALINLSKPILNQSEKKSVAWNSKKKLLLKKLGLLPI